MVHGVGWGCEIFGTSLGSFEAGTSGHLPQLALVQDMVWIRCQCNFKSKSIALAILLGTGGRHLRSNGDLAVKWKFEKPLKTRFFL